jgi:hypothetical protein
MDTPRSGWGRSKVAPARNYGKSILLTPAKKAERAEKKLKTKRLRKVHFNLPKANISGRNIAQALDPRSPTIRRWQSIMLFPLSYELWAFPYRLALGSPSMQSKICASDLTCDAFFLIDILVALCTAIPSKQPGDAPITSFPGIARHYFTRTFPAHFLPCTLYWVATPICAYYLAQLCPDPAPARRSGRTPWDAAHDSNPAASGGPGASWRCVVENSGRWPVLVWWLSTIPRIVPRALRLKSYFKAMESDLVPRHPPPRHPPRPPAPPSRVAACSAASYQPAHLHEP